MNRVLAGVALLLLVQFVAPPPCWPIGPLGFVLPSPGDVVSLIDTLTKRDSRTNVDVRKAQTFSQGKLLVARTKVDVALERSSRNWRGQVLVQMTVPTEISYSIDLQEIRPSHITLDAENRLLIVAMPPLKVEDVTPLLSSLKAENTYKRARFRRIDNNVSKDLQNTLLTHDYQARARKHGEENIASVREQARTSLQDLLQRLLGRSCPGVKVVVD